MFTFGLVFVQGTGARIGTAAAAAASSAAAGTAAAAAATATAAAAEPAGVVLQDWVQLSRPSCVSAATSVRCAHK